MLSTDPRELTDAQTRELVRRGIAKGRRMNATRRAVSGAAALAVVGALGAGTFALVSSMNQDVTPAAPASPPATSPASPGSAPSRPPAATRLLSSELLAPTLEEQLPAGSTVTIPEDTAEAGYSASASVPTDDGHATVLVDLIDWRQGDRLAEWGFAHPVPGHPDVWFVSGTADAKQGENSGTSSARTAPPSGSACSPWPASARTTRGSTPSAAPRRSTTSPSPPCSTPRRGGGSSTTRSRADRTAPRPPGTENGPRSEDRGPFLRRRRQRAAEPST